MEIMTWHLADAWPPGRSTRGLCHKDSPYSKGSPDIPFRPQRQDSKSMQAPGPARANAQDRAEQGGVSQSQAGQAEPAAWPLGL